MRSRVHGIAPLGLHDADVLEVGFDGGSRRVGGEGGFVDEEGFVLEGSIGREAVGGDLMRKEFEGFEGGEFGGHVIELDTLMDVSSNDMRVRK